ncbi:hypothetical protein DCS_08146 [Drechmeria coniospora]|uniref:Uncharacterized protein n=1 Tax=Drechmeria coniospora TaxID=98403 RepID=A0A151GGF6_DRECN|nr:hypothetical protein DCS_08146 [Drechmeria coniospora]KYK56179.1 hypothetical protein DCS_08146 [Drechmeria coniospora]
MVRKHGQQRLAAAACSSSTSNSTAHNLLRWSFRRYSSASPQHHTPASRAAHRFCGEIKVPPSFSRQAPSSSTHDNRRSTHDARRSTLDNRPTTIRPRNAADARLPAVAREHLLRQPGSDWRSPAGLSMISPP